MGGIHNRVRSASPSRRHRRSVTALVVAVAAVASLPAAASASTLTTNGFQLNYDAATRQMFIEDKSVECPTGTLAVGSFSARVSEDGRELLDGRWGDTPGNKSGWLGKWHARR